VVIGRMPVILWALRFKHCYILTLQHLSALASQLTSTRYPTITTLAQSYSGGARRRFVAVRRSVSLATTPFTNPLPCARQEASLYHTSGPSSLTSTRPFRYKVARANSQDGRNERGKLYGDLGASGQRMSTIVPFSCCYDCRGELSVRPGS
jgi:hypothetical protein